jgi:hypothetical protein
MAPASNSISFDGRAVGFLSEGDLNAEVLVVAEQPDGSGQRLEISRSVVATEQDRRLGMNTYCLVNEKEATVYGGVTDWSCDNAELRISLTAEAGEVLGASVYRIRIPNPGDLAIVRDQLDAILGP